MRRVPLIAVTGLLVAAPAFAQFNAYYEGTQKVDGKDVPVTSQFSVEKGRCAMKLTGARAFRMVYIAKDGLLRVFDDTNKSYFDLAKDDRNQMTGMMSQMQEQMAKMPPEQREMMQKMTGGAMGGMKSAPVDTYVQTGEKQTVQGYDCEHVVIMRDQVKHSDYWGTRSSDFALTKDEIDTRIAMQEAMGAMNMMVVGGGGGPGVASGPRPFEFDPKVEGYPLISRCFDDSGQVTLDVHLTRFDRKPLEDALFEVDKSYTTMDFGKGMGGKDRRKHHVTLK